jgi:DNA replication protein DnaC
MDGNTYTIDGTKFEVFSIKSELNNDEVVNSLPSESKSTIKLEDFQIQDSDFYLHIPDPEKSANPDLWLSSKQKQFVEKEMPVLLTGSAGSGKTTILIYHALRKSLGNNNKVLYVTYNKFLQKEAERIAKEVFPKYPQNLKFCHYLDLCTF